jgi:hypothetical protein
MPSVSVYVYSKQKNKRNIQEKNKTRSKNIALFSYYFFETDFSIRARLLAGELSTLIRSFRRPTIIPITVFTLLFSATKSPLMTDFERGI